MSQAMMALGRCPWRSPDGSRQRTGWTRGKPGHIPPANPSRPARGSKARAQPGAWPSPWIQQTDRSRLAQPSERAAPLTDQNEARLVIANGWSAWTCDSQARQRPWGGSQQGRWQPARSWQTRADYETTRPPRSRHQQHGSRTTPARSHQSIGGHSSRNRTCPTDMYKPEAMR